MTTETKSAAPPRAGAREWAALAVLALPTILLGLDNNVLFLALPHLTAELAPSGTQLLWITDIYGFMIAGFLVTMGSLGDRIGRRRLLLIGATAFGLASIVTAYASSPEMLIGARALLGVAGATLMPSTLALISTMFLDGKQRATAIAVWMSAFLVGGSAGPIVGGLMLDRFWWGSVFLLGVPVMAVLLALGRALLPESRSATSGPLDLVSVGLSIGAILPAVYGLKELATEGVGAVPILTVLGGAVAAMLFVRRQRLLIARSDQPLVDLRLFGDRAFSTAVVLLLLVTMIMGGALLFVTQYLQLVQGLTALHAALWLLPSVLALAGGNMLAPLLVQRVRPGALIAGSLLIVAVGLAVLTQVPSVDGLAWLIAGYGITSLGMGPLATVGTDIVVGSAPPEQAGSASSLSETSSELGIALGVALFGSVGAAAYRSHAVGDALRGLPTQVTERAQEALAGAVAEAGQLTSAQAAELLAVARGAFTSGLHVVAGVSAAVALLFAVVALAVLRRLPAAGDTAAVAHQGDHHDA
ncbi:MFS transporter [Ruania zhangjianzhongii]|uniref:MFS transporter n=1 Tax=Ruania zhangjianzhongii TaxID=2603206 RepID=UPI0011CCC830|nr:MFS transporter [Ruania zhangjianzhongii]